MLVALFCLVGCAKISETVSTEDVYSFANENSTFRSEKECIEEIESLWDDVYGVKTKSAKRFPEIINTVLVSSPVTKASEVKDTIAFLFNFSDDQGFALVRAQRNAAPIVALTDSGNLEEIKLLNDDASFEDNGEKIMYGLLRRELFSPKDTTFIITPHYPTRDSSHISTGAWYTDASAGPLVHVKWGQAYPFNKYMPTSNYEDHDLSTQYKGRYPAGCTIIATAQIMVTTQHPSVFSTLICGRYLSSMTGISTYSNYTNYKWYNYDTNVTDSLDRARMDGAADMIRTIASRINASYSQNGTGAWPENAMNMLIQDDASFYGSPHGQSYEPEYNGYDILYNFLSDGKPMPMWGWRGYTDPDGTIHTQSGHTWVMDGYLNRHRHLSNGQIESQHLIHFNWGWQGRCDGYFSQGVVDLTQRVMRDNVIDTNNQSLMNRDYCYNTAFYIYGYIGVH